MSNGPDISETPSSVYGPLHAIFLLSSAFFCGAAIMIVELAGNRILAPWFGNSLYTWTGLIGVVLTSISIGYYLGGYLADKFPSWIVLSHVMLSGSLLIMLIPFLQSILEGLMNPMDVVAGPMVASIFLFALPGVIMASVTPFTIRLVSLMSGDKHIGCSAGRVGMLATLGSVLGTFATGFLLIPAMHLSSVFLATGIVVALFAMLGYILFSRKPNKGAGRAGTAVICLVGAVFLDMLLAGSKTPSSVLFDENTFYHRVRVTERVDDHRRTVRTLHLDSTVEGGQFVEGSGLPIQYQRFWELSRALTPYLDRALFLGGGAFGMPEALLDSFPGARVDVVELDPKVIEVGRRFFRVNDYPSLNPVAGDARRFLRRSEDKYDFIFGDAYNGLRYIPAHLVTREFFELVRDRMNPNGVFLINIISSIEGEDSELFTSIFATLSEVFGHVSFFANYLSYPKSSQNIVLVASIRDMDVPQLIRESSLTDFVKRDFLGCHVGVVEGASLGGTVFTDSYNPVESMVAKALLRESRR